MTAHNNQIVPNNCKVVVKLKLRGSRPLLAQDWSTLRRIRLYANRQDHSSVRTISGVFRVRFALRLDQPWDSVQRLMNDPA